MTNRIANHLPPPEPDPKKNDNDETDLTKASLPKDTEMTNPALPDASAANGGEANQAPSGTTVSESLRDIRERQEAADQAGSRLDLSHEDLQMLAAAAKKIRDSVDQNTAPPVDHDLVYKATWNLLPDDLAEMVQGLRIRYKTWNEALLAEESRAIAIQDAAESN